MLDLSSIRLFWDLGFIKLCGCFNLVLKILQKHFYFCRWHTFFIGFFLRGIWLVRFILLSKWLSWRWNLLSWRLTNYRVSYRWYFFLFLYLLYLILSCLSIPRSIWSILALFYIYNSRLNFLVFSIFWHPLVLKCLLLWNLSLYNRLHEESLNKNLIINISFVFHFHLEVYILVQLLFTYRISIVLLWIPPDAFTTDILNLTCYKAYFLFNWVFWIFKGQNICRVLLITP